MYAVSVGNKIVGSSITMSVTSADFILEFFRENTEVRFADLTTAMCDVDRLLHASAETDKESELNCRSLSILWQIIARAEGKSNDSEHVKTNEDLPQSCEIALLAARRLASEQFEYSPERVEAIRNLANGIPDLLKDVNVPKDLATYVILLTREVTAALDEFEITGIFKLESAFSRLTLVINSIMCAPKSVEDANKLKVFFQEKVVPALTVANLIFGIPVALNTAVHSSHQLLEGGVELVQSFDRDNQQAEGK